MKSTAQVKLGVYVRSNSSSDVSEDKSTQQKSVHSYDGYGQYMNVIESVPSSTRSTLQVMRDKVNKDLLHIYDDTKASVCVKEKLVTYSICGKVILSVSELEDLSLEDIQCILAFTDTLYISPCKAEKILLALFKKENLEHWNVSIVPTQDTVERICKQDLIDTTPSLWSSEPFAFVIKSK